ncbi:MAG: DUF4157 domain-containing protein, partial [Lysobacterales bacterium]
SARKSRSSSDPTISRRLLQRKCACGGSAGLTGECEECKKTKLQRKLSIGAENDPLEQEADRVADQVMTMSPQRPENGAPLRIQRIAGHVSGDSAFAPASVDRVLAASGRPLEPVLQRDMGQRFGYDFSEVRIHTGAEAEQSAQDVNAFAYTVGNNIVFGAERFDPCSFDGRRLIAHELTHVVQQSDPHEASVGQAKEKRQLSHHASTGAQRRIQRLGANPGCTKGQAADIHQAIFNANSWVRKALTALGASPLTAVTLRALRHNFGASGTAANAGTIATKLRAGRSDMLKNPYSCANATDATCATAPCGYTSAAGVHASVICTNATLATNDAVYRAGCVLHEAMHASDASMTVDSYSGWFGHSSSTAGYPGGSPLTNADSYTTLAMELS